ncbi:MYCBP-associated protein-like [Pectinophora gossypiella]|uniref:MYCBP-associated protein-like n=1 Tax=Pectinophora gossypiella TaxID=13191 RepID=UPI00214E4CC3|nr:MYCBP-associated protein-like [Pectinophora gossypiella]
MAWNPKDDIFKEFAMTFDSQLLHWEDWVKIRNEEIVELSKRMERPPADLAMNVLENIRPKKERKKVLEEAQVLREPHIRDSLWENANRFRQRCRCDNVYEVKRTRAEKGHPRVIEHVRSPDYIQKTEKGLMGVPERKPCPKLEADYLKYRDKREEELKEQILKIDPFRAEIEELCVIGTGPKPPPKRKPILPNIEITEPNWPCRDALAGVYALRINNTVFYKDNPEQTNQLNYFQKMQKEPWHEPCTWWTYYFKVPESKIGRSKIYLENLGTVTLSYCWKRIKKTIPFIPEDNTQSQKFFFRKGEDVIAPGQRKVICLTFVSDVVGIFNVTWELSLSNVCLFDDLSKKFIFNLVGDAYENIKNMSRKIEKLESRIEIKAINKAIYDMLNDVIIKATEAEHQIYPYKKMLLEREMFVAMNPVCFYHQTEVQRLKELYEEMTGKEWDLSIPTWRQAMIEKEFDERMSYYDALKISHAILLKPVLEGEDVLMQKYRAVKLILGQLFDRFYDEYDRVSMMNGATKLDNKEMVPFPEESLTPDIIQNIFVIRMYEHIAFAMEVCAGVISSIDLNRWIEFDFCRY